MRTIITGAAAAATKPRTTSWEAPAKRIIDIAWVWMAVQPPARALAPKTMPNGMTPTINGSIDTAPARKRDFHGVSADCCDGDDDPAATPMLGG